MEKYYFELFLENKNGTKHRNYSGIGATLNDARKELINNLERREKNDFTQYDNELQTAFIAVNKLNAEQVQAIKLLTMFNNDYSLDNYDVSTFNFYEQINFPEIEKLLNRKLKNIDYKTHLNIAIDCLASGDYNNLKIVRRYK